MAHNLNFNQATGRYSFFSVQQKAWHGLGQIVADYPTSAGAIKHAGLDFAVVKAPLFTRSTDLSVIDDGEVREDGNILVPDYFATMRTDTNDVFGVVGKDYQIVQNADAFTFFDASGLSAT